MGNDSSVLSEYSIDESPYAQIGLWTLHSAEKRNVDSERVTVFTAKLKSYGKLSKELERAVESLKTMRHPAILRYLNSCLAGDVVHLFVEYVAPLSQVLHLQSELEICSGLQNILIALDFIHSKASIVHNNVCRDAIFVTRTGEWKLGYFDLSCRFTELNQGFLDQIRSLRYDKCIPPEDEGKISKVQGGSVASRDIFSYGQLVRETINKCLDSSVSNADVFADLASKQMQSSLPNSRGSALSLSRHTFFDQPLLRVQDFLAEIAIKNTTEKDDFFKNLPSLLYSVPESVVGSKLAKTLLSRMVVLNTSAQQHLLPHLLTPRTELCEGLFDVAGYREYILPVLSRIFPVRDAQIRLLLLNYFPHYVPLMERDSIVQNILPELLLGIKDTDDVVVAATLKALADLVPILGGQTVIGGTRLKLFTNGAPKPCESRPGKSLDITKRKLSVPESKLRSPVALPERHEPDGGEDDADRVASPLADEDHWSDWEAEEQQQIESEPVLPIEPLTPTDPTNSITIPTALVKTKKKQVETDLSALEIQVKSKDDEIDYFADMEPTITKSTPSVYVGSDKKDFDRLSFNVNQDADKEDEDGWNWDD